MNAQAPERDWLALAREVLEVEADGLSAVRQGLGAGFLDALTRMARCTGRVVVTGIGKSGLVGRKVAATLSSTGTPSYFLHPVEGAHGDMGMIRPEDVVLAISYSGETEELVNILPAFRALGAAVVALTGEPESSLGRLSDVVIPVRVPREACPMGLAPTASTTAALAVGDALAVCLMEYKGFDKSDFRRVHPGGSLGRQLSLFVESLMHTRDLPVASQDAPLAQALEALNRGGLGLVALLDDGGRVAGVLSDGDVRRLVCKGALDPASPAYHSMTKNPRRARVGDSAAKVLDVMEAHQITVLPVVSEDERLAGMIHLHDLLGKGRLKFASNLVNGGSAG
jgi:arabinose-5-phosphate isomerase